MSSDLLISTREALEVLGLASPSSITHLVQAGKLSPAKKLPGSRGAYLFDLGEVERCRDERRAQ